MTLQKKEIHLYIDDSGSRDPDHKPPQERRDQMDYFALGGILLNEEDTDDFIRVYKEFRSRWNIDYPLHSWAIRGGRGNFGWLKKPEAAFEFLGDLEKFLIELPIIGTAAVIDRPGYAARYSEQYKERLWLMCKTAYSILIERSAKFARSQDRSLRVFFERAGKQEDRDILTYARSLKTDGMPFDRSNSAAYNSLTADEFREIVRGEPRGKTKETPMIQVADLVLYPIAKGGYDPAYRPYATLMEHKKLIDAILEPEQRSALGIKYSCFDRLKQ